MNITFKVNSPVFLIALFAKERTKSGKVVIAGRSKNKLEYAKKLGFDVVDTGVEDLPAQVKKIIGIDGADEHLKLSAQTKLSLPLSSQQALLAVSFSLATRQQTLSCLRISI